MFDGSGPGAQTLDGCSVELYRRLPYLGELDTVQRFLTPDASILELGCGTGRHTRMLLEWGLRPTCVDNSPEMLAELPVGAIPVHAAIETVALSERFDIALLASCLINHPNSQTRGAFIGAAARHLRPGARLLLERHDPQWLQGAAVGTVGRAGPAVLSIESVTRVHALVEMKLCYVIAEQAWRQSFVATPLTEQEVEGLLSEHRFHSFSWHGPARMWVAATYGSHDAA
jgi:SAM-dependent methyltransferase